MSSEQSSSQARLQSLVDTWSSTKANGFLSKAAPYPLPSQGPLHKLLMTTKRLLPDPETIVKQTANDAVTTGAALVIAKIANWLQQQPDQFLMCQSSLNMELWVLLLRFMHYTVAEHLSADNETSYQLLRQLVASGKVPNELVARKQQRSNQVCF
jgi:hypothetical protein